MAKPFIPLTVAKAHLRVEHDFDDELIGIVTEAAVDRTLQEIGLAGVFEVSHVTSTSLAVFGFQYPVERIVSVEKRDAIGEWQAVPDGEYRLGGTFEDRHTLSFSGAAGHLSGGSYRVAWDAGFGEKLPAWFKVACFFLIAHYYENRSSVIIGQGISALEVPMGFVHLCRPHRRWFFA